MTSVFDAPTFDGISTTQYNALKVLLQALETISLKGMCAATRTELDAKFIEVKAAIAAFTPSAYRTNALGSLDVAASFQDQVGTPSIRTKMLTLLQETLSHSTSAIVYQQNERTPNTVEVQTIAWSNVPDAGHFIPSIGGVAGTQIEYTGTAALLQAALRTIPGYGAVTVTGTFGTNFVITFTGVNANAPLLTVGSNTLTKTSTPVTATVTETTPGVPG